MKWVVVWRITEVCDLGCPFCGYSRHLRRSRTVAEAEPVRALGQLLGDYAWEEGREILVSWLGGEPLHWPPLLDLARVFRRDFGLHLGVTTNGTALSQAAVRRRLVEDFDELTLSVDGPPALHDRLRAAPGLHAQLRAGVARLRELKERAQRGPRLRVNMVLMHDNVRLLEEVGHTAAAWGVEELTFNALGGRDRPEFFPEHRLLPDDVAWLCQAWPGLRARLGRLGLTVCGNDRYLERLAASAEGRALPVEDCSPGQRFLFVDEHGLVSPCSYTGPDYGIPWHDLRAPEAIRGLPARLAEKRRGGTSAACADCASTQVFGKFSHQAQNG